MTRAGLLENQAFVAETSRNLSSHTPGEHAHHHHASLSAFASCQKEEPKTHHNANKWTLLHLAATNNQLRCAAALEGRCE